MPSTKDKYTKIRKEDRPNLPENEIRISKKGSTGSYIVTIASLLLRKQNKFDTVILKATENAIPKCILIAEVIFLLTQNTEEMNE